MTEGNGTEACPKMMSSLWVSVKAIDAQNRTNGSLDSFIAPTHKAHTVVFWHLEWK